MSRQHFPLLVSLLALALVPACSMLPTAANPTPVVIVVTATPDATRAPVFSVSTPTPRPSVATVTTASADGTVTVNMKATDVKYVRAKQDINIRNGPGTDFDIVGGVFAGNTAEVNGFMSADGLWWRVVCPVDNVTDCWVSADSALTEKADAPEAGPTGTVTTEVSAESFVRTLATDLQNKNYDALSAVMSDPFHIGYWRSEGTTPSRDEALVLLKNWIDPAIGIVVDLADKTDQTKLLDGQDPLKMWDPSAKIIKTVYLNGLAQNGEALLVIAQRPDNSLYWYGILYAANGGFDGTNP